MDDISTLSTRTSLYNSSKLILSLSFFPPPIHQDELEYKKKHRPLKIKLQDGTIKTVLVDDTLSVSEIVMVIGEKLSMNNAEEFSLKTEGKGTFPTTPITNIKNI